MTDDRGQAVPRLDDLDVEPAATNDHGNAKILDADWPSPVVLVGQLTDLGDEERLARIHGLITWLAGQNDLERQRYRNAIVTAGHIGARDWTSALAEAKKAHRAATRRRRPPCSGEDPPDRGERTPIRVGGEAATIRTLTGRIGHDALLPEVYVTNGALVHLTRVSGDTDNTPAGEDPPPLPVLADPLTSASLARLLAHHAYVHRLKRDGDGIVQETEVTPSPRALAAILSGRFWPHLLPLYGIVGAPALRPDGTLLQTPGYDQATGLYLAPKVAIPDVPTRPQADDVAAARTFILDALLADFPFVAAADRANHIGLLVAQILRPYLRCLTPFGLVSATTQSSGKTLLADIIGHLYGYKHLVWRRGDDAELEKSITAALRSPAAAMIWDNLAEATTISSPILAQLLTSTTWSGRILGTNTTFDAPNDRLWLATGNNLRLGGDMATRTVLIRLDPNDPHPETRDQAGFGIPHLDQWLKVAANRVTLLRHLLILVMDWMAAGAPRSAHTMRQFTAWAAATGGLLAHHGIDGFLDNLDQVREADEDNAEWAAFLARWHDLYGPAKKTAREIRLSADIDTDSTGRPVDRWQGTFLTDDKGRVPSGKSVGRLLTGHLGRWHGPYVLRSEISTVTNCRIYWVEAKDE